MDPAFDDCFFCSVDGDRDFKLLVLLREIWTGDLFFGKLDSAVVKNCEARFAKRRSDVPWLQLPWMILVHNNGNLSELQHVNGLEDCMTDY